ncbi:MAG: MerR family transcriptional regulator [Firmicutes bacterium]|nr:MerR family transcriptional regulator [Bacillota bacterium]
MAGVSRRTVDYYTGLGLLKPERAESGYRYYTDDSLLRLKLIESMKNQRLTLAEIKGRMNALEDVLQTKEDAQDSRVINLQILKEQFKQLEEQLVQLQPLITNMEAGQAAMASRQVLMKSMALMQSLIMYLSEAAPFL